MRNAYFVIFLIYVLLNNVIYFNCIFTSTRFIKLEMIILYTNKSYLYNTINEKKIIKNAKITLAIVLLIVLIYINFAKVLC